MSRIDCVSLNFVVYTRRFVVKIKLISLFFLMALLTACDGGVPTPAEEIEPLENIVAATLTPAPTATPFPIILEEVVEDNVLEAETKLEPVPEPTNTPFAEIVPDGVVIEVPATLAGELVSTLFEEAISADPNSPFWANYPAYTEYRLEGYPIENNIYDAQIEVYPVRDFASINIAAAEQIEALQQILATQPDLTTLADRELPFLPLINAAQIYHTHEQYVTFANGRGVRYLTQYSQAVTSVNNAELFYTFQGISDDGRSYISAIFPVNGVGLPGEPPTTSEEIDAITADHSGYIAEAVSGLLALAPDQFTPRLDELDGVVASSLVNLPEPEVEITDAGRVPLTLFYPRPNGQARTGRPLHVEGYTNPGGATTLLVSLRSGVNQLASETFFSEANGHWSGELQIPYSVEGVATLTVSKANEEISSEVILVRDFSTEVPGAVVDLSRPLGGEIVVSGYTLFLEGRTTNPIDDTVTVGVLVDNCSTFVARQSFPLASPGGSWNANIVLPRDLRGEGCVVAYTGEYGVGEWREVHVPVSITDEGDSRAPRLSVASLFQSVYAAGDTVYVYGSAVDTSTVTVRVLLLGEEEILVSTVPVGDFGFWEVNLELPAEDVVGFMVLEVTIPEDEAALSQLVFEVK